MQGTIALLIVILPLASAIINGALCLVVNKKYASIISTSAIIISALFSLYIFYYTGLNQNIIHITLGKWFEIAKFKVNWAIYVDQLTAIMFLVVTCVSSVVHVYSLGYMAEDTGLPKFLSFLSLFTFFMLMLVSADNFLQLFFGWEGVGLCSYLLIGFWYKKEVANKAAIKAFIVNRIGDFAFILGIIAIIFYCRSANFTEVFLAAKELANAPVNLFGFLPSRLDIICLLLFIGCMGKSAQIGLHVWLPDAMEGPTPVSALIHAATMVTAGVFLVARCSYLFEYSPAILQFITIIGGITCLFAASIAIAQSDIKKIIAYSTCSQLGYMFLACGVSAYNTAIFHLVTHAFFKALLFLSAGSVIHAIHEQDIFKMGGLRDKMPVTYGNFLIGSLALIGIYPLSGFYSKDLILESVYSAGSFMFIFGIIAAILTAIYSMKIIILVFHGKTKLAHDVFEHAHEPPSIMNNPLTILVAGSFFCGMIGYYLLSIDKPGGYFHESIFSLHIYRLLINHPPLYIKMLPMVVGIIGIIIGICVYRLRIVTSWQSELGFMARISDVIPAKAGIQEIQKSHPEFISGYIKKMLKQFRHDKKSLDSRFRGNDIEGISKTMQQSRRGCNMTPLRLTQHILQNKYYFDEIYELVIVKPLTQISRLFYFSDQKIIDRFGPEGFSRVVNCFGFLASKTQTGYVFNYTLYIVLFVVSVITFFIGLSVISV
ncbi:MAG: NADH-quinone oxidoreductase subunit L [Rickettsia endosymbiont of Oxypoda opaca]|nr:NADH-quinone oxidoreductase subunit L [Rickettsia endosymbiont of Oxypoda opaca]